MLVYLLKRQTTPGCCVLSVHTSQCVEVDVWSSHVML